jgi:hypothetical protein
LIELLTVNNPAWDTVNKVEDALFNVRTLPETFKDAVTEPVVILSEAPTPANDPENDPVNEVAITDPETRVEPETISPFFTINSPAIYFLPLLS